MPRAFLLMVLVLGLGFGPACSCNKQLSADEAARACVVLQACFPNEWRNGFFGGNLAYCASGASVLPPAPGALIGPQFITTGLEGPLADVYRCVLAAGSDCAKAGKCWGRAGTSGSCSPSDSLEHGTCNGQVLSGCTADGFAFDIDCAAYGGTCHQTNVFWATVGLCDLGNCPAKTQCHGSVGDACEGQGLWQADCSRVGMACVVDPDAGAICRASGSCDGGAPTCEGTTAVSCSLGTPQRMDCALNGTMKRCNAGSCVETGNECTVAGDVATCDGSKVRFCQDGTFKAVDCASLGFSGCVGGACSVCSGSGCACTPTTCAASAKNCGSLPDGCGGTLDCGTCTLPATCGGGGIAFVCGTGCTPTTCAAHGWNCGTAPNGCGVALTCGSACLAPQSCGGGGAPNVCGCTPLTACSGGLNCGTVPDGCGGTVACGTCTGAGQTCGGGGVANVCGACTATTCTAQGWNCGTAPDGCGGTVSCGTCNGNRTCGAAAHNVCAVGTCTPTTCTAQGKNCGVLTDGCAATLNCGTCGATQTCVGNVCQ